MTLKMTVGSIVIVNGQMFTYTADGRCISSYGNLPAPPWYINCPKFFKHAEKRYKMKQVKALIAGVECTAIEPIYNPKQAPRDTWQEANRGNLSKKARR